jgi:quinolinate synthase
VPTITCTSSNVVRTVLQAFAQVPGLTMWYGPDTYMGENLRTLFESLAELPDAKIAALHPAHDRASVRALLSRFEVFQQGNCVVHHMFGDSVAAKVAQDYGHAFHTAHLEVPGTMFAVANAAAAEGRGVVGSTSDILNFIVKTARRALEGQPGTEAGAGATLSFVLGTEAGMVTPIVRQVQALLASAPAGSPDVAVEIVFPVAADAIAPQEGELECGGLAVVPGAGGGEGCSTAGGCATCPYMKMNSLDALVDLAGAVSRALPSPDVEGPIALRSFLPLRRGATVQGRPAAQLGSLPILHMRALAATGALPQVLVDDVLTR